MKRRLEGDQKGFTIIELVMVIVIIGILSAVAIPKFVDLKKNARVGVANGVTGAMRAAVSMLHAQYLLNSASTYNETSVTGQVTQGGVTLTPGSGSITALIDSATATWAFTANGGIATPAVIADPTTTGL